MSNHFKSIVLRWLVVVSSVIVGIGVLLTSIQVTARVQAQRIGSNSPPSTPQPAFLFRFDSSTQTFFTFTLPPGSLPNSVAVSGTNPTHVWIAESGRDQIGQLVYTTTTDFSWTEYPVTSTHASGPFRLTIVGDYVWFTERGANRIGRLDTTTHHIDEFYDHGLSLNAGLADIKVAPDGKVWATEQWSNRLLQLTITSTADYAFREYTHTLLISPVGLAIESSDDIWVTSRGARKIGEFWPSVGYWLWPYAPDDGTPTELVYFFFNTGKPHSKVWFSDMERNSLGLLFLSTLPVLTYFGPVTRATGLASESQTVFWSTQQDEQGAVVRLTYTDELSTQIDSYPLPTSGLFPTAIAVAPDHGVWLAAYRPARVYLPIMWRN